MQQVSGVSPGVHEVSLTKVRAADADNTLVVFCAVEGRTVLWSIRFEDEVPEGAIQALDRLPPMKWLIGEDGQIEGISDF